jgi:hypothetical protein
LQIETVLSVLNPALILTEGTGLVALAYNRVQNNGKMLLLAQALMMLQSGTPRHYFTGERGEKREFQSLLRQGLPKRYNILMKTGKHTEVTRFNPLRTEFLLNKI